MCSVDVVWFRARKSASVRQSVMRSLAGSGLVTTRSLDTVNSIVAGGPSGKGGSLGASRNESRGAHNVALRGSIPSYPAFKCVHGERSDIYFPFLARNSINLLSLVTAP